MKQKRLSRRQQQQLRNIFAVLYADSFEYCEEHLNFLRRRHQRFSTLSGA
jgi:hypothetical protein